MAKGKGKKWLGPPDIVERTFAFGDRVNRLCRYLLYDLRDEQDLAR